MTAIDYRKIPALCINLDHRTDRWKAVQQQFATLNWPVERFSAVSYAEKIVGGIDGKHAGALDSHRGCWRLALARRYDMVAVFEDDAVFPSDFSQLFPKAFNQLPTYWRFWQFHSSHAKTAPLSPYIVRLLSGGWGAHGYLVNAAGCRDLLSISKYNNCDVLMTGDYLALGGQPLGMPMERALCFQVGDKDSNIPVTDQAKFWRAQRLKYCR